MTRPSRGSKTAFVRLATSYDCALIHNKSDGKDIWPRRPCWIGRQSLGDERLKLIGKQYDSPDSPYNLQLFIVRALVTIGVFA